MNNNLLVIGSYPERNQTHGRGTVGVASYTKNTLLSLPKDVSITVLAEQLSPDNKREYSESNIAVKRIWKRNSLLIFPTLLKEILINQKHTKNIIIPLELAMFGNFLNLSFLPFFILALRLLGKEVVLVFHHVIADIRELSGHIYTYQGRQAALLNLLIGIFYKLVMITISKAIVMEEFLAKRLSKLGKREKIVVIPHGVEDFSNNQTISKSDARKQLGIPQNKFVLLYFGFLAYYKGADWLVDQFKNWKFEIGNLKLILAGGPNPNHMKNKNYQNYIRSLKEKAKEQNILITGFVPQEKIPLYFKASDVIVFPYRTFMSASGPLSMAFSFAKPFVISKTLEPLIETNDIKMILSKLGVSSELFVFHSESEFKNLVESLTKNTKHLQQLQQLSDSIKKQRSWELIGKEYEKIIL